MLDSDLRRRDPESYRRMFRLVQERAFSLVRDATRRDRIRAIADLKFCFRRMRRVIAPVAWDDWGEHYPDRAGPADHAAVVELIRVAEGERSAAIARHWLGCQPGAFHVIRGADTPVRGVIALLDLTAATPAEREVDPGATAAWEYVAANAATRPGEVITQCRFVVDTTTYQRALTDRERRADRDPAKSTHHAGARLGLSDVRRPGPLGGVLAGGGHDLGEVRRLRDRWAPIRAASLGLPFSTYRRHLSQGTDRVVGWMWSRELGIPAQ